MSSDTAMSDGERTMRRSFRIRENAFIRYRKLNQQQMDDLLNARAIGQPSKFRNHAQLVNLEAKFREAFTLLGQAPAPVRDCLNALNDKINLLLEEQPERQEAMREMVKGSSYQCEIGATGIRFDCEEQLEEGQSLFIQVMLISDRHYLETTGVVRAERKPLNDDPMRPYGVGVEFIGLGEGETELLIKHLFQRESESLRMRRLKVD